LTLGYVDPAQLQFNDRGQIVSLDGRVINTLHQYDRHPELAQKLVNGLT
jgi:hypothetical protein